MDEEPLPRHDLFEGEDWFIRGQPPPRDYDPLWFWRDEIEESQKR